MQKGVVLNEQTFFREDSLVDVSQGSVLGQPLLITYIDSIHVRNKSICKVFADGIGYLKY